MFRLIVLEEPDNSYTRVSSCEYVNTKFTPFTYARLTTQDWGSRPQTAKRNPLTAPARALPAGHITLAEALLSGLDHPWPHRGAPRDHTGTVAYSMVLLATHLWALERLRGGAMGNAIS